MISAIILNHNIIDTKKCIESIESHNYENISEIIVIQSLSNQVEYESKLDIKILSPNSPNYSFSTLCNMGIEVAKENNDILIMSDNCYFVKESLYNLEKALHSDKNIGIVTPITNIGPSMHHQSIDLPFNNLELFTQFLGDKTIYDESKNEERLRTSFLTTIIKRELINTIGNFDEQFTNTDYVSDDYCLRALKEGYKNIFCSHSFVYIKDRLYFNYPSFDQGKFKLKWGFDPLYSLSIRTESIDKIAIDKDREVNVLEVGCACGATLLKLKSVFKNVNLYGVDISEESIKIAKYIDGVEAKCIDVESEEFVLEDKKFDLIIALDVIEHLRDPWKTLKNFKKSLKDDGQLIISIPNVMHISIINNLIQGRWDYQDCGLLDRTHLRFFTLKTIKEAFGEIGYDSIYYHSIFTILNEQEEKLINTLSTQYSLDTNQLRSYQYIITNKM
ncbi:methyltransferase domain-containing protein [Paraclostridium dentum]|uniref:methyltransferase domain-containing protein n=1 Tax=Paraclostridium dentum TaxID=2662455 RepID=UPI003F2FB0D9